MPDDERERHRRAREQWGLRADPEWVDWVAEHGTVLPMQTDFPMTDDEIDAFVSRQERASAAFGAFRAAALASDAGAWLDNRAGGVVRLLLAHPDTRERAVADGIVAEHGGTVELVEHSTRELDAVRGLIDAEMDARSPFGQAVASVGRRVSANTELVTIRGDLHPDIPAGIQAAVDAGAVVIDHPTEPFGWEPGTEAGTGGGTAPDDDEPVPRWPGDDTADQWAHQARCVQYVADRCVGGPLATAERLAEDIGLAVRVIYPGSFRTDDLRSDRITFYVNAEHVVRYITAG